MIIENLAADYGNKEVAKFFYECKMSIFCNFEWIPFNEFENIEYLAKGGFVEVHKASKW